MKQLLHNIQFSLPIILVSTLTLLLLTYVGSWEASRQYSVFQSSKLATQGEIVSNAVESYLHAGLPLSQYSAFQQISSTLLRSDDSIEHISIYNPSNQLIFFNQQTSFKQQSQQPQALQLPLQKILEEDQTSSFQQALSLRQYQTSEIKLPHKDYLVEESDKSLRLTLPLKSKFGLSGILIIEANKSLIFSSFEEKYHEVFIACGFIILIFSLFTLICEHFFHQAHYKRGMLKTFYALSFLAMSGVIVTVALQIYEQGAQTNTKALTDSMVARLNSVLELNIKIEDISGISKAFANYQANNPNIREIALIENGLCKFHTQADLVGTQYVPPKNVYEYRVDLSSNAHTDRKLYVSISLPVDIVHKAALSSANEFITLMIACGLISLIFINASTGISRTAAPAQNQNNQSKNIHKKHDYRLSLSLVQPAYFIIVFVHALSISFLPNMVSQLAESNQSIFATLSFPFTIYYALFALVLIPAGHFTEKMSLKWIMAVGCLLEVIGLMLISTTSDYWILTLARAFSGAGQGFFLIGLQSYLLVISPKNRRTQGSAVKVIARNSGLIAGTSIGALIFSFTSETTVFLIGSSLSVITMFYLWLLVPDECVHQAAAPSLEKAPQNNTGHNLKQALKDTEFIKSLLLIAIPGKMAITGVIMFAIPLLLSAHGLGTGEIGQALMLYYIASIITTHFISHIVDSLNISRFILYMSTLTGGFSLILLGFTDVHQWNGALPWLGGEYLAQIAIDFNHFLNQSSLSWLSTATVIACLIMAGISNGLLTSPIVTHINKTQVSKKYGVKSVTASYTFLERGGHILGPMFIGYLLTLTLQSNLALSFFGFMMLFLGTVFIFFSKKI
ncbi:MAG: MFS transporter [Gammaproteobacteria bacterium]|nr:MFS transporter [Gammaproteobacteria bacterium]